MNEKPPIINKIFHVFILEFLGNIKKYKVERKK
jgi:hypothetical protein